MPNTDWQNDYFINPYITAPPSFIPTQRVIMGLGGPVMVCMTTQDEYVLAAAPTMINEDA